jgi:hypothetical protein
MRDIRARMLGDKCYGSSYKVKDLDTGETLVVRVGKRADTQLLMHLMAFRIFKNITILDGEILSAIPDRTTNRFASTFETKTWVVYKPKTIVKKPARSQCIKGQHVKKCACPKPAKHTKRFGRKGRR